MGYYTDFELSIYKEDKNVSALDIIKEIYNMKIIDSSKFYPFDYEIEDGLNDEFYEKVNSFDMEGNGKWYDCNKEMLELSKAFPNVIFQLHGEGEESGDIWTSWYKNGKVVEHKAKIVIEDLDESEFG